MEGGGCQRQGSSPTRGPQDPSLSWNSAELGNSSFDSGGVSVADDKVFLGMGQTVMALSASTGKVAWSFKADRGNFTSVPYVHAGTVFAGVAGGDGAMYAINSTTGRQVWKRAVGEMQSSSPLAVGDILYVANGSSSLFGLGIRDGSVRMTFDLPVSAHSSIAYGGGLLFGAGNWRAWALNLSSFRTEYSWSTTGYYSSTVVYSNYALFVHTPGSLECFSVLSGLRLWRQALTETFTGGALSAPVAASGMVCVGTQGTGNLQCFNPSTGNRLWTQKFNSGLTGTPAAARNGMLYVPADGLWAVDMDTGGKLWSIQGSAGSPAIAHGCVFALSSPTVYAVGRYAEDKKAPSVSILSPQDGACQRSGIANISGTVGDDQGVDIVEASTDGVRWSPMNGVTTWNGSVALVPGRNILRVRAVDTAGKTTQQTVGVVMDVVRPGGAITQPPEGANLTDNSVVMRGTAQDDFGVALVEVGASKASWTAATGTVNWSATISAPDGKITLYVRVTDGAGNTFINSTNVTMDGQKPIIQLLDPLPNSTLRDIPVKLTGTVSDNIGVAAMEVSVDGIHWKDCDVHGAWTACIILDRGPNIVSLRATDIAGNEQLVDVQFDVHTAKAEEEPVPAWPGPVLPALLLTAGAVAAAVVLAAGFRIYAFARPAPPPAPGQYPQAFQQYADESQYQVSAQYPQYQQLQQGPPPQYQLPQQYQAQPQYPQPQQYPVAPQYQLPQQYQAPGQYPQQQQYPVAPQYQLPQQYQAPAQYPQPQQYPVAPQYQLPQQYQAPLQYPQPQQYPAAPQPQPSQQPPPPGQSQSPQQCQPPPEPPATADAGAQERPPPGPGTGGAQEGR